MRQTDGARLSCLPPSCLRGFPRAQGTIKIGVTLGLYGESGKEHGNYYILGCMLGLYWDSGRQNGNYYVGFRA